MGETIHAEVLVVGAGPAGLAAALAARRMGKRVVIADDNPNLGGQIWRSRPNGAWKGRARSWIDDVEKSGAVILRGAAVVDQLRPGALTVDAADGPATVHHERLVLATGARELFLPFPGWTLPGVMGAGGAQAVLKSGADFSGKRVVVAGSGPLLLPVAATIARAGGNLVGICEQADAAQLGKFARAALTSPAKLAEAMRYWLDWGAAHYSCGIWPCEAIGSQKLEAARLTDGSASWIEPCDVLACGFGLVPNLELPGLLGCEITDDQVLVNERLETSVEGVYAAGELLGIGGLDLALVEGAIAGGDITMIGRRQKLLTFRDLLAECFALRPELTRLARPDTILCRCEDVRLGDLDPTWERREAKLYTRLGMGPCQGRICGPAVRSLFGWTRDTVRPPLFPVGAGRIIELMDTNK